MNYKNYYYYINPKKKFFQFQELIVFENYEPNLYLEQKLCLSQIKFETINLALQRIFLLAVINK